MTHQFIDLVKNFEKIENKTPQIDKAGKMYKARDCTAANIQKAYKNVKNGICLEYDRNKVNLDLEFPLVKQGFLC